MLLWFQTFQAHRGPVDFSKLKRSEAKPATTVLEGAASGGTQAASASGGRDIGSGSGASPVGADARDQRLASKQKIATSESNAGALAHSTPELTPLDKEIAKRRRDELEHGYAAA